MATGDSRISTKNSTGGSRLVWADSAKGLSILLVVLWHVTGKHLPSVYDAHGSSPGLSVWELVSIALEPARMPLFFIIAGMFAKGSLSSPLMKSIRKPLNNYYVFLVWLVLSIPITIWVGSLAVNPVDTWYEFFAGALFGATGPWFLYALAVYFILANILKNTPIWLVLLSSALVSIASFASLFEGTGNLHYVAANAFFYFLGIFGHRYVKTFVARARLAVALPLFLASTLLGVYVSDTSIALYPVLRFGAGLVGCYALMILVASLTHFPGKITRGFAWIGGRTLGIYVLHLHLLVLWEIAFFAIDFPRGNLLFEVLLYLYVPATVILLAAACVLTKTIIDRGGLGFIFKMPSSFGLISIFSTRRVRNGNQ